MQGPKADRGPQGLPGKDGKDFNIAETDKRYAPVNLTDNKFYNVYGLIHSEHPNGNRTVEATSSHNVFV